MRRREAVCDFVRILQHARTADGAARLTAGAAGEEGEIPSLRGDHLVDLRGLQDLHAEDAIAQDRAVRGEPVGTLIS